MLSKSLRALVACLGSFALFTVPVKGLIDPAADPSKSLGVTVEWDANPEPEVAGYNVYVGRQSRNYHTVIDSGAQTSARVPLLEAGVTFYFAVTAYTVDRVESEFSEEVIYTVPIDGTTALLAPFTLTLKSAAALRFNVSPGKIYLVQASEDLRHWQTVQLFTPLLPQMMTWIDPLPRSRPQRFYRVVAQNALEQVFNLPALLPDAGLLGN